MGTAESRGGTIPPPSCLAFVIADAIWRDPGTGKRTILGCFSAIHAREFPAAHGQLALYIALTEGRGTVPLEVRLVRVDAEDEEIAKVAADIEFRDPRMILEVDLHVRGLVFPMPGEYRFQVSAQGEFLIERRLVVAQLGGGEQDDGPAAR